MEFFSPPSIRVKPSDDGVFVLQHNRVPPWHPQHPVHRDEEFKLRKGCTWQHTVFGGVFALERMRDAVVDVFGDDPRYRDERLSGRTALFALTVTATGRVVKDSAVLSTCAWAVGRTLKLGPQDPKWLDDTDWRLAQAEFGEAVRSLAGPTVPTIGQAGAKKLISPDEETTPEPGATDGTSGEAGDHDSDSPVPGDRGRPLTAADLLTLRTTLARQLGVEQALDPASVWVVSRQVPTKAAEGSGNDFLNSFILNDLARAAEALDAGSASAPLTAYLCPGDAIDTVSRIDVRERPDAVLAATEPTRTPAGRWVSKTAHPLVLSQQFAVNRILGPETADSQVPVFAVNGPPGTGKTTMLRDVIAGLVVHRAERLAELSRPEAGFVGGLSWSTENWRKTVRPLKPELTGFEMVVACANNGAAKNITHEFPGPTGIDDSWWDAARDVDFFADAASIALGLEQSKPDGRAWAALAGALGAMKYRKAFVQRIWWGVTAEEERSAAREERDPERSGAGLADILTAHNRGGEPVDWPAAVARFRAAKAAVDALATLRQAAADAGREMADLALTIKALTESANDLRRRTHRADTEREEAESALSDATSAGETARQARAEHATWQPKFWVVLSTWGRAGREWSERDRTLAAAVDTADAACAVVRHAVDDAVGRSNRLHRQLTETTDQLTAATRQLDRVQDKQKQALSAWPGYVPTSEVLADDAQREMLAPWSDQQITEARTRLFLEALRLHKAFILANGRVMRQNLYAAFDVINGTVPENVDHEAAKAAWQSLFLAVPVVSTTFASAGRLFSHLGPEDLGWVFIDEAGQAAPQNACGALLRARRAVIVGDPLQLEPVVTLPHTVQQALREHFAVDEQWLPGWTSVQAVADRLAPHGTWLDVPGPDGTTDRTWVGAPLRVHRRCDDPMFTISNTIAYGGTLMVNGKPPVQPAHDPYTALPSSRWEHVEAPDATGTWIPAEGEHARRIVDRLLAQGVDPAQIKVISPFRDVVDGLKGLKLNLPGGEAVGTIHTMQGKEADIVLLVLGSDPRKPGQRGWAAAKPNLLNVAASRAKRRLYVIGNRDLWKNERYFAELARRLETRLRTEAAEARVPRREQPTGE
ncbi:ATP-binding protein [Catenulispora sp. NL8]|uniref:ATP-binding protein n=1 Tax=Catenulispora pinistramenti TaxID=2705254 RepID=A0ABS5KGE7_9ACTN|nr:ATP-binding protein [Catenulispora pinistramenti]MBS2545249.1 ATP-binding protein [Catenulispora pinistramenti]